MKKWSVWLLALTLVVFLVACGAGTEQNSEGEAVWVDVVQGEEDDHVQGFFDAEVLEIREKELLVRIEDSGNCSLPENSTAVVSTDIRSAEGCPELKVGSPVRVVFDGRMIETEPVQLGEVFSVYRMDQEGNCIKNDGTVDFGPLPYDITLTVKNVTPTALTLVCTRSEENGESLWTDSRFRIERYLEKTNGWEQVMECAWEETLVWKDIAYNIPANGTVEWEINWEYIYGTLPQGQYRVVKTIYNQAQEEILCCAGFLIPA